MPQFMDFHDDLKLPAEAVAQITADAHDKRADEFGVRQVELYHNDEGKVYCLLEAPTRRLSASTTRPSALTAAPCTG
jgi:hypothetical protein